MGQDWKKTGQRAPLGETEAGRQPAMGAPGSQERRDAREDDDSRLPIEGRPEFLNDVSADGGGQISGEVGLPYNGEGEVRRGVEKEQHQGDVSKTEP